MSAPKHMAPRRPSRRLLPAFGAVLFTVGSFGFVASCAVWGARTADQWAEDMVQNVEDHRPESVQP